MNTKRLWPRVTAPSVPTRFLGLGFCWAWIRTFLESNNSFPADLATSSTSLFARSVVCIMTAMALIAAAALSRHFDSPLGRKVLALIGASLGPIGSLLICLEPLGVLPDGTGVMYAAWGCLSLSCAAITLLWGLFYSTIDFKRACLFTPLSLILAEIVSLALNQMNYGFMSAIITLLPLLSVALFLLASTDLGSFDTDASSCQEEEIRASLWRLYAAIGVFGTIVGFLLSLSLMSGVQDKWPWAISFVNLVAPLCIIALLQKSGLQLLLRLTLPFSAAGFLLLPILSFSNVWIAAAIILIGFNLFDVLAWIAMANGAHRSCFSPIKVFGIGRAMHMGGHGLGWAAGCLTAVSNPDPSSPFLVFSLAAVFILIITATFVLNERDFCGNALGDARFQSQNANLAENDLGAAASFDASCSRIADRYGLSPREKEVLRLLAKGHTVKYIEQSLFISFHTAKSHVNHIYKKLDVHSKNEVIDLVERESATEQTRTTSF